MIIKILNYEKEIDEYDLDFIEQADITLKELQDRVKLYQDEKTDIANLRKFCEDIQDIFINFFGDENAAKEIFGERQNLMSAATSIADFVSFQKQLTEKTAKDIKTLNKKMMK